jgi:VanZ family protein
MTGVSPIPPCLRFALRKPATPGLLCAVSKLKSFAKYWLPVLIWMAVIYSASGDRKSVHHSSRIIEPIVRWLFPRISDDAVYHVVYYCRKGAHVTEFAILAILLRRAIGRNATGQSWSWKVAGLALFAAFLYAASDEIHQAFVPDREGRPMDVLIDTGGAALGLAAVWLFGCWRKRW